MEAAAAAQEAHRTVKHHLRAQHLPERLIILLRKRERIWRSKIPEVVEVHVGQGVSATDTLPDGLSVDNNQYTDYLLENFNIKVVVDWTAASGNDYTQKVALCIASNTLPDAMTVSSIC